MKLGFATAILPDLPLEEVAQFAAATGYECIEVMCWPPSKADRRYAGITHIDVTDFSTDDADIQLINASDLFKEFGVIVEP